VTLEENILRQRVTTDIATKGGQYDVMTIGTYEAPIWAKQGWLVELDDLGADYDVDDLLPAIRGGLSMDGKLFAAPFYGESSMVMYRKDLMEAAGMEMPGAPTWDDIKAAAAAKLAGAKTWPSLAPWQTPTARAGLTKSGTHNSTHQNGKPRSQITLI
jgi:sorbitol/mannitol transport system substrate-binding protein